MEGLRDLTNTVGVSPGAVVYYLTYHTSLSRQINYHCNHPLALSNQNQRRLREREILLGDIAQSNGVQDDTKADDQIYINHGLRV
jgi:hypothetical protein